MSRHSRRLSVRFRNLVLFSVFSTVTYQHWCWRANEVITTSFPSQVDSHLTSSHWLPREARLKYLTSGALPVLPTAASPSSSSSLIKGAAPETHEQVEGVETQRKKRTDEKSATNRLSPSRGLKEEDKAHPFTEAKKDPVQEVPMIWDVLVVGGGLTGLYTAVEAAQRGLRVALVEAQDLGGGNTSQSPGVTPGPLAYVQRAIRQRDPAWCKEAWHALRRERIWSAVTASPSPSSSPLSLPVWSMHSIGLVTHHFTEWMELSIGNVFTTLLTWCSGYGEKHTWWTSLPRWISASKWDTVVLEGNVDAGHSGDRHLPSTPSMNLATNATPCTSDDTGMSSRTTSSGHQPEKEREERDEEKGKEEEEAELVYGVVCSKNPVLHGPLLAARLARTAEALGVCILTYAPLCGVEWHTTPTEATFASTPVLSDHGLGATTLREKEPIRVAGKSTKREAYKEATSEITSVCNTPARTESEHHHLYQACAAGMTCESEKNADSKGEKGVPGQAAAPPSSPFFKATIVDLLPSSSSGSSRHTRRGNETVSPAAPSYCHTVYARRIINCAGAWVDEVKSLLPEAGQDPLPRLLDEKKHLQVKHYLVVPRMAVKSLRKRPSLTEEASETGKTAATTTIDTASQTVKVETSSPCILSALQVDGLQASPTAYSFSPTLVLPWVEDCVLIGPSYSLLPSLPSWSTLASTSSLPPRFHRYHLHMADGYASAVSRLLLALQASHIQVDREDIRSCISSWAPVIRSPSSFPPAKGEGPVSISHMTLLSQYLIRQYHIGLSCVLHKTATEASTRRSQHIGEEEGSRRPEKPQSERESLKTRYGTVTASSRSPLMEAVAGNRPDYYYDDDEDEGDSETNGEEVQSGSEGVLSRGVSLFTRRLFRQANTTTRESSSSSSWYEAIPFVHVYGGNAAQARDIALEAMEKVLKISPFQAPQAKEEKQKHSYFFFSSRASSPEREWGWWKGGKTEEIAENGKTDTQVANPGNEVAISRCRPPPLPVGREHKPLVLLPLPWEEGKRSDSTSSSLRSTQWETSKVKDHQDRPSSPEGTDGMDEFSTLIRMMVRHTYAEKVSDILFRRWRVGYSNPTVAYLAARRIAAVMGKELGWSAERVEEEVQEALEDIQGVVVALP